jgi:signal transduction histidine kinase
VRFLLIEDDPGHALLLSRALTRLFPGCTIDHEDNLTDVISSRVFNEYSVAISDLSLPDAAGLEAVRQLNEHLPLVPLIVLTSMQDENLALEALEYGAQDFLSKMDVLESGSSGGDQLRRAIRYAIQRQEALKENNLLVVQLTKSQELMEKKNRRLEQLCDTSQRFVDNVSHEFRTPLTVIKEYSSLIRDGVVGTVSEEQIDMLNVIDDRTDDLNNMVDDLLDTSRLEAGLLGLCRRGCDFNKIVEYLLPSLKRKAVVRRVSLITDVPEDLPIVWCDGEKIGRVIIYLIVNAIKFCGEPGWVLLTAERDDHQRHIVVSIQDNGSGIPSEKLEEIFNRFEQGGTSVRQSTKGFGLGLAIAKELVDLNLGKIEVECQPQLGTTFSFTIPYAEQDEVLRRQFAILRADKPDTAEICLVSLSAELTGDERDLQDLGLLLQQDLRIHDQLFRVGARDWLAVLAMSSLEFSAFTRRFLTDHYEVSRNRPKGDLPKLHIELRGNWQLAESSDEEIMLEVQQRQDRREIAHVS